MARRMDICLLRALICALSGLTGRPPGELDERDLELAQRVAQGRLRVGEPVADSLDDRSHRVDRDLRFVECGRRRAPVDRGELVQLERELGHDDACWELLELVACRRPSPPRTQPVLWPRRPRPRACPVQRAAVARAATIDWVLAAWGPQGHGVLPYAGQLNGKRG